MSQKDRDLQGRYVAPEDMKLGAKLKKSFKEGEKMFKAMISAIPGMGMFADLLISMADATGILAPFQAVLDVIMGLFGVMGAQIIPVLMQALLPFINLLIEMQPVFVLLGKAIALLLEIGLIPFTIAVELLYKVMYPFLPLFEALIPLVEAAHPLIEFIADILSYFIDLIVPTQSLAEWIEDLAYWAGKAGDAIDSLIGWIRNMIDVAAGVTVRDSGGGGGGFNPFDPGSYVIGLQEGTHRVPQTGFYKLHAEEEVKPSGYSGVQEDLLENIHQELRVMNRNITTIRVGTKY